MIYLDTSVVLAQLLAEDHRPPAALWSETLVSSRLMEYEIWTRLHARTLADSHGEAARRLQSDESRCWSCLHRCLNARWRPFPSLFPYARSMPYIWRPANICATKASRSHWPATTTG